MLWRDVMELAEDAGDAKLGVWVRSALSIDGGLGLLDETRLTRDER